MEQDPELEEFAAKLLVLARAGTPSALDTARMFGR